MDERPYIVCPEADCVDVWGLVDRWKGIPSFELDRLVNNKVLQLYERTTSYNTPQDNELVYLKPYNAGEFYFGVTVNEIDGIPTNEKALFLIDETCITGRGFVISTEYGNGLWDTGRYCFLLSNIEELEAANPGYLTPTQTKPSPLAGRSQVADTVKEESTRKINNLLRMIGGLMYDRDIKASQIREKIQAGGFGDLSENTIRNFIKETQKVKD